MAQHEQVPQEAVQVHVCLGATAADADKQRSTRSTAELLLGSSGLGGAGGPSEPACTPSPARGSTCSSGPAWLLWLLFVLGFICPPCWWAGSIVGLQRKRKGSQSAGMNSSSTAAWHGCIAMSVISTVAVVLGVAIHYGRKPHGECYRLEPNRLSSTVPHGAGSSCSRQPLQACPCSCVLQLQLLFASSAGECWVRRCECRCSKGADYRYVCHSLTGNMLSIQCSCMQQQPHF